MNPSMLVNTISVPRSARLFFCTDVHGEFDALQKALAKAQYDEDKDYLISCGDLCDRGPQSLQSLAYFFHPEKNRYAILGNHEQLLLEAGYLHYMNGGAWATRETDETLEYLRRKINEHFSLVLTVVYKNKTLGCVHAEVPYHFDSYVDFIDAIYAGSKETQDTATWGRDMINHEKYITDVDFLLHGHTTIPEVMQVQNRVYFDTGSWASQEGKLTLLEFTGEEFKQYTAEFEIKRPRMHP